MKLKYIFISLFAAIALFSSCDDDVNDWKVENGEERLFMPLIFETSVLKPISVQMKHTKVIDAATYLFEFSKDEQFATIEQSVNILADTLTVFSYSTSVMKVEYRTWFEGLDGTTDYWVRMHAVDEGGSRKSNYVYYEFTTPAEQIFKTILNSTNTLTFVWEPTDRVTHIVLTNAEDGAEVENHTFTVAEKEAGAYKFQHLEMGVHYVAQIFNDEVSRGIIEAKTTGLMNSAVLEVVDGMTADDISGELKQLVGAGKENVTIQFESGKSHLMEGTITLPTGLNDVTFAGAANDNGVLSALETIKFAIETEVNDVTFENMNMTAGGDMMFNIDNGGKFHDVLFEGCEISKVNSVVRLANGAEANLIKLNNCWVSHTGGWGMLNVGSGNTVGKIVVTNCTLTEINTRFADVRVKTDILFKNVTACNINEKMGHLWLLDNNSKPTVIISDCIISGPNGGQKLHSTNGNYSNVTITYGGNYKTNDLIEDERELTLITEVNLDIYGLFADPENGDFHIKSGAGFAGDGVAGDPRWFN